MASMYTPISSLLTDWMACATSGNRRNRAHPEGSSRPHCPSTVRSVQSLQILLRTIASNSTKERVMRSALLLEHKRLMHAGVHDSLFANYWILQRFDAEVRFCGGNGAEAEVWLGDIPLKPAGSWDLATRKAAAMMASRTVLRGSSSETTDTIPAS